MKIKDPIWLDQDPDQPNTFCGKVPEDLIYLKDHFAEFPLVPGVVELQWVYEKLAEILKQNITIEQIKSLKFQQFLRPSDNFELTINILDEKHKAKFSLKHQEKNCASGIILFKIKG